MGSSPTAGDNLPVRDSYFHGFTTNAANGHIDGVQTEGASHGRIIHNSFDMPANATSAVAIWNSLRRSDDWTIADNLFTGGGFTLYAQHISGPGGASARAKVANSAAGGHAVTNIRFLDNRLSTSQYPHDAANHSRALESAGHGSFAAAGRRTSEGPPTCGMSAEASARATWCWRPAEHRSRRAGRMRGS